MSHRDAFSKALHALSGLRARNAEPLVPRAHVAVASPPVAVVVVVGMRMAMSMGILAEPGVRQSLLA